MKLRAGFVSNSSSCSFTCEVCGASEGGYDSIGMLEYGFTYCGNHHLLCLDCLTEKYDGHEPERDEFDTEEEWNKAHEKWEEEDECGEICPSSICPVCQFIEPSQKDMAKYLEKEYKIPRDRVFAEIKKVNKRRKKLYDFEYINYVCIEKGVKLTDLLPKLKEEFETYEKFRAFLNK